jgi:hypothetical protein
MTVWAPHGKSRKACSTAKDANRSRELVLSDNIATVWALKQHGKSRKACSTAVPPRMLTKGQPQDPAWCSIDGWQDCNCAIWGAWCSLSENTNSKREQHTHSEIDMFVQWSDERGTWKSDYAGIPVVSPSLSLECLWVLNNLTYSEALSTAPRGSTVATEKLVFSGERQNICYTPALASPPVKSITSSSTRNWVV